MVEMIHKQETLLFLTEIRGEVHVGNITKTMPSSTGSSRSSTAWLSALSTFFRSMAIIACYTLLLGSASAAPVVTSVSGSDSKPQLLRPEEVATQNAPDDRSNPLSQLMAETNLNKGPRVKVFVYHHPELDFSDLIYCFREKYGDSPWQAERADMAQDMGEIWLHRAMLEHPWRVLEADEADLFYIPIYPVLSYKLLGANVDQCRGLTHEQRMENAVNYLQTRSVYFRRFGGSDHLIVCAWWNCRNVFSAWQRMVLRRVVLGINEAIKNWAKWGCGGRSLTIPYTANSVVTTPEYFGGAPFDKRDILFFFVGSTRKRPERKNLEVVQELYPESIISFGEGNKWGVNATQYASYIIRSKFCFCPRGDSKTSRRIFDAVAAGCIPVLTTEEVTAMPFFHAGLNYSEFAVVAPKGGFSSEERVTAVVKSIASRSDEKQEALQRGIQNAAVTSLVYGLNDGPDVKDMHPILGVASRFLSEAMAHGGGDNLWTCKPTNLKEQDLAPRTNVDLPPTENSRRQWLFESETIINTEHSLLFCAPPNAGSLQFRMLAKRMESVEHWGISDNRELLFDPTASGLSLLDLKNGPLMNSIYRHNDGGWIKIGVVRDPITRLVSSYLDYVHALESTRSPSDGGHRGLRAQGLEWFEGVSGRRRLRMHDTADYDPRNNVKNTILGEMSDGLGVSGRRELSSKEEDTTLHFERNDADGGALQMEIVGSILPTFPDLVEALENSMNSAPPAFQPISNMCGMRYSPFDSIIPFETLQKTSTEVLKSLPGGLWDEYGASGWGPDGKYAFMEFDYGSVLRHNKSLPGDGVGVVAGAVGGAEDGVEGSSSPLRARDLFEANSCDWVKYYPDEDMLERVAALFSMDYGILGWYSLDPWIERLHGCLGGNT